MRKEHEEGRGKEQVVRNRANKRRDRQPEAGEQTPGAAMAAPFLALSGVSSPSCRSYERSKKESQKKRERRVTQDIEGAEEGAGL